MPLFRNTADLKLYTDVHKQTDWSTLKLYVQQAEPTYIIPVISRAMYDKFDGLINLPANANKTFDEIFTDQRDLLAFNFIASALANYALFEAFPFLNTTVGDIGVAQQSSKEGTANPAAQWRYESRRWAHLSNADRFSDQLLIYLESNSTYFTEWAASSSFTITKELFVGDAIKLSNYIGTNNSRRAYLALRAHLRMAEKKYILPALGQPLYDQLKTEIQANPATITDDNKKLLPLIEEAVSWAAYYEGLPFMSLKFNTEGVQVISANDGINNKNAASKEDKDQARSTAGHNADTFLGSLKRYLIDNESLYPLFAESDAANNGTPRYRRPYNYAGSGMFRI